MTATYMSSSEPAASGELDVSAEVARIDSAMKALSRDSDESLIEGLAQGGVQEIFASVVRLYARCTERDPGLPAFPVRSDSPSATEALIAVTAVLDAVQVEPFELGLWATWGVGGPSKRTGVGRDDNG